MSFEVTSFSRQNSSTTHFSHLHRFFFHPFEERSRQLAAIITHVALTILTGFIWQIPFWIVRQLDKRKIQHLTFNSYNQAENLVVREKKHQESAPKSSESRTYPISSFTNSPIERAVRNYPKIHDLLSSSELSEVDRMHLENTIKQYFLEGRSDGLPTYQNPTEWFSNSDLSTYGSILTSKQDSSVHWPTILYGERTRKNIGCSLISDLKSTLEFSKEEEPLHTKFPIIGMPNNNHFVLIFVDFDLKTIEYYDSMVNYGNHEQIINNLEETAAHFGLKVEKKVTKCLQKDGYQCGAWFGFFLEKRLENEHFDPNTTTKEEIKNIKDYRVKIIAELIVNEYFQTKGC